MNLNYRFENVQDDKDNVDDADASTLRLRFGAQTKEFAGFSGRFSFEETNAIGNDENYNSGVNTLTQYATVPDPTGDSLDEAYLQYRLDELYVRVGRQFIQEANGRLIGAAPWRQNQQTFDAARVSYQGIPNTELHLMAIDNAINVKNQDTDTKGVYFHGNTDVGIGKVRLQYLVTEAKRSVGDDRATALLGLEGHTDLSDDLSLTYLVELGQQTDAEDNTADISANYSHVSLGIKTMGLYAKIGNEVLGADKDANKAFVAPISNLHAFNGFADIFLSGADVTKGLVDTYLNIGGKYDMGLMWTLRYHLFSEDDGNNDYGSEIDFAVKYKILDFWSAGLKYANYMADDAQADGTRFGEDKQITAVFTTLNF